MNVAVLLEQKKANKEKLFFSLKKDNFFRLNFTYINFSNIKKIIFLFMKLTKSLIDHKIDKIIVICEEYYFPFLFFSKQKNICVSLPLNKKMSSLSREHNDANVLIIKDYLSNLSVKKIIKNFLYSKFSGQKRHCMRLEILHQAFTKKVKNNYPVFKNTAKTILITSDHRGYKLKKKIYDWMVKDKHNIIDLGPNNNETSHYSIQGIILGLSMKKNYFGISICNTGIGISNTINKFKNINCSLCFNQNDAFLARQKYNCNILALSAKYTPFRVVKKIINNFLNTYNNKSSQFPKILANYGFNFDQTKFKKIIKKYQLTMPKLLK